MKTKIIGLISLLSLFFFLGRLSKKDKIVIKEIDNKKETHQETKKEETKSQVKVVYRTITKYSNTGKIMEVINENTDESTKSNDVTNITSNEVSQTTTKEKNLEESRVHIPTLGIGFLLPASDYTSISNFTGSTIKYELVSEVNITDNFAWISSVDMDNFKVNSFKTGFMIRK